jgi:tripartite-type tricarboxylate transporter receptor subunit TctC
MKIKLSSSKAKIFVFLCLILTFLSVELGYPAEVDIAKYPNRPITYINPITPGGPTDLSIRALCKEAEKFLGQPIVVANKPGAVGSIGCTIIAGSKPDGYTIGYLPHSALYIAPFQEKVSYHPVRDFKPIMQYATFNFGIIVKEDSPFKSFKDLIDYARANPLKLVCGTTGPSSLQYHIVEKIAKKEKVQFTHMPFKGNPEMQIGLLGGHIQFGAGDFNYSYIESKQMRVLLLLREEPSAEYPNTPILKDFGYDISTPMVLNVAGPKGMPEGFVKKLEEAFTKAIKEQAFVKLMKEELRLSIVYRNSKELSSYIASNYEIFEKLFKEGGMTK